jgi:hypothetical protein
MRPNVTISTNGQQRRLERYCLWLCVWMSLSLLAGGCTTLLPSARLETTAPWRSYAEAEAAFAKLIPNQTRLSALVALRLDPATTANVALLNHVDLLRRFAIGTAVTSDVIDESLRTCLAARLRCTALEIDQSHIDRNRVGSFWMDFLNFERIVDISGWRFNALIVLHDDLVVYKLWSGKPNIRDVEIERNPLGPLQGIGGSAVQRSF